MQIRELWILEEFDWGIILGIFFGVLYAVGFQKALDMVLIFLLGKALIGIVGTVVILVIREARRMKHDNDSVRS